MKSAPEQHANPSDELRSQLRETWATVQRLLLHPTNPRRDARGRTVQQVLADMILESFEPDRALMALTLPLAPSSPRHCSMQCRCPDAEPAIPSMSKRKQGRQPVR
jgi:hypothetical protein